MNERMMMRGVRAVCDVCKIEGGDPFVHGWRLLWVDRFGQLGMSIEGAEHLQPHLPSECYERALTCGQTHALILTERYLERGTFAPADFHATSTAVNQLETTR